MAGTSLLALLDDIATLLDDISLMSKVAAKKTAGLLGDDLALNAEQFVGIQARRELPVVWAVAKGSLVNKLILVPAALLISAFASWMITLLLMCGGAFLCFEGFEKIAHRLWHQKDEAAQDHNRKLQALRDPAIDPVKLEKKKIRGAIRTDMILSAEIIVVTLGTVREADLMVQIGVLSGIALVITIGIYALVAGIVKLDDAGLFLIQRPATGHLGRLQHRLGRLLLSLAPYLMKTLSVLGTAAMFLVGGGILVHGLPGLHHTGTVLIGLLRGEGVGGAWWEPVVPLILNGLAGLVAGAVVFGCVLLVRKLFIKPAEQS